MKKKPMVEAIGEALSAGEPGALGVDLPGMSSEQAQDAAALAQMVADAGTPVTVTGEAIPEPEPEQIPRMSAEESLSGLLSALPHVLAFAGLKNTAQVWSVETCQGLAVRVVPVLKKYPWGARVIDFLETGAGVEEIALGMFLVPVGLATAQAWKADAAAIAGAREKKPDTVTPPDMPDAPDANQ